MSAPDPEAGVATFAIGPRAEASLGAVAAELAAEHEQEHQAEKSSSSGRLGWLWRRGRGGAGNAAFRRRLRSAARKLEQVYEQLSPQMAALSDAQRWLRDNDYLVRRSLRQVRHDMPRGFYLRLPRLRPHETRIEAVIHRFLTWSSGVIEIPELQRFLEVYQRRVALDISELWAVPTLLRLTALERLAGRASDETIVAGAVLGLHEIRRQDWTEFVEGASAIETVLAQDPALVYRRMDIETRDRYRKAVELLATLSGQAEPVVAEAAVRMAAAVATEPRETADPSHAHVGAYLIGDGRARLERQLGVAGPVGRRLRRFSRRHAASFYVAGTLIATGALTLPVWTYAQAVGAGWLAGLVVLAALVPAWLGAEALVQRFARTLAAPRTLPKIDLTGGITKAERTLVVIPALLSSPEAIRELFDQLERHYVGNDDPNISFALLGDLADAQAERTAGDEALLDEAMVALLALRKRQSEGGFHLLCRDRKWNASEGCWMAWERKRGKLAELNRLILEGERGSFRLAASEIAVFRGFVYVITLDADTLLPPGSAKRLIGAMAHPLNRPRFDTLGRLRQGYSVLQPRMDLLLTSANRTRFSRIFSGSQGVDLYTRAVSDPFMDLFGEGLYAGKGIYDVAAFERSLRGKVPENAILSHDIFEGGAGRAGLLSDVVLYESFPETALAHAKRGHRWTRGDWQLLPWLNRVVPAERGPGVNPLSWVARWAMRQNMARGLLPPVTLLLFLLAWLVLPGSAVVWTLMLSALAALPFLLGRLAAVRIELRRGDRAPAMTGVNEVLRWLLEMVFLPFVAFVNGSAIAMTLKRLWLTRRGLLQWRDASRTDTDIAAAGGAAAWWYAMAPGPLAAVSVAGLIAWARPEVWPLAAPFLLAWLLSPQVAYLTSRPPPLPDRSVSQEQRRWLMSIARRTWHYVERFVGPNDHWLPPDHFQESPKAAVAHRTSPTNIGLLLSSTLGAYDMGFIGARNLVARLANTFGSMRQLERHRGHFLNWYDTQTMQPLASRYVSTVDSGNLLGCLVVVKEGCLELAGHAVLRWKQFVGVLTLLDLFAQSAQALGGGSDDLSRKAVFWRERITEVEGRPELWSELIEELMSRALPELDAAMLGLIRSLTGRVEPRVLAQLGAWSGSLHRHVEESRRERDTFLPWLMAEHRHSLGSTIEELPPTPSWDELGEIYPTLLKLLERRGSELVHGEGDALSQAELPNEPSERLSAALKVAAGSRLTLLTEALKLAEEAEAYLQATEFDFLFDHHRKVLRIGFHVDTARLDVHVYDLLASEARLASFMAIALGRVPPSHWVHLGRPVAMASDRRVLLSWSGTMFEYLMPSLVMNTPRGSTMAQSIDAAIAAQITYGRAKRVPWGISESGYAVTDAQQNYQYRAFGVPDLALSHESPGALVVAPYATLMALQFAPRAALENLQRLVAAGALGRYGFYDALDYSAGGLRADREGVVVASYMVHHHGMAFMAMTNLLEDDLFVRRFHRDVRVQSSSFLLEESPAAGVPLDRSRSRPAARPADDLGDGRSYEPWGVPAHTAVPQVHSLSNGRYTLFVGNSGGGSSRWRDLDLTRWRSDPTRDCWGQWLYMQDLASGEAWSAGRQPVGAQATGEQVTFHPHKVEIRRRVAGVASSLEVTVAADADVEIRRITITNDGDGARTLAVTSYGEVVLAQHLADLRHPAFGSLFIESSWHPELNALLFRRRPRAADEKPVYLLHRLVTETGPAEPPEFETDRGRFLGRNGNLAVPAALRPGSLGGAVGETLDPIFALRTTFELRPYATVRLAFITIAGESRREVLAAAERFAHWDRLAPAFAAAKDQQLQIMKRLDIDAPELAAAQRLLSSLLYPDGSTRALGTRPRHALPSQPKLWLHGISGEDPILLAYVSSATDLDIARLLLKAHRHWREQGFKVDLVLLNLADSGYLQAAHGSLRQLVNATNNEAWLDRHGGIFLLSTSRLDDEERGALEASARVIVRSWADLSATPPSLATHDLLPTFIPSAPSRPDDLATEPLARPDDLVFDNGYGGFSADGSEYLIYLDGRPLPAPWVNVIANEAFGCLVGDSGASTTWAVNSGENRLTPWSNDAVLDPSGEVLYLRDEETASVWTPTPQPMPTGLPYLTRHGAGVTTFEHRSHGLEQEMRVFVLEEAPLKVVRLRLRNLLDRPRRVTATYYLEWVLGSTHEATRSFILPEFDTENQALLASNPFHATFGPQVAFLAGDADPHGLTTDRREFLGSEGNTADPAAMRRIGLSGKVEAGLDPCAALQLHIDLPAGGDGELHFLIGRGADRDEAVALLRQWRDPARLELGRLAVEAGWRRRLGAVRVRTPDRAMDLMLNQWLLYQTVSCRLWGRSAFYQSSGAYGFRDQLQDVMALLHSEPELARRQILRAARHQFEEGDVLHWWHPPTGQGVRTRFSDDLAWLPFVTSHYVEASGDQGLLDEVAPFLTGPELGAAQHEHYDRFQPSEGSATIFEHCCRALDRACTQGSRGLPLIGSGDWNDGFSRVGIGGKGESVWLAWFLVRTLSGFAELCESRGEVSLARRYRETAQRYRAAVEASAWDGDWYLRAFFDDGAPLGSHASDEARIDAIAQAWAVLSGAGDPHRSRRAMAAVDEHLVREQDALILLLAPPFDKTRRDPGYIKGYRPGLRENGGQYTHAALWVAWAQAALGNGDRAHRLFELLNPVLRAAEPASAGRYRVEPYVVAADVYGVDPHIGRGGWTWYTGSASWMYRLGIEALLGLRRIGAELMIDPCIPAAWPSFEVDYRYGGATYRVSVSNPGGAQRGVTSVSVDDVEIAGNRVGLVDDGAEHRVDVVMG